MNEITGREVFGYVFPRSNTREGANDSKNASIKSRNRDQTNIQTINPGHLLYTPSAYFTDISPSQLSNPQQGTRTKYVYLYPVHDPLGLLLSPVAWNVKTNEIFVESCHTIQNPNYYCRGYESESESESENDEIIEGDNKYMLPLFVTNTIHRPMTFIKTGHVDTVHVKKVRIVTTDKNNSPEKGISPHRPCTVVNVQIVGFGSSDMSVVDGLSSKYYWMGFDSQLTYDYETNTLTKPNCPIFMSEHHFSSKWILCKTMDEYAIQHSYSIRGLQTTIDFILNDPSVHPKIRKNKIYIGALTKLKSELWIMMKKYIHDLDHQQTQMITWTDIISKVISTTLFCETLPELWYHIIPQLTEFQCSTIFQLIKGGMRSDEGCKRNWVRLFLVQLATTQTPYCIMSPYNLFTKDPMTRIKYPSTQQKHGIQNHPLQNRIVRRAFLEFCEKTLMHHVKSKTSLGMCNRTRMCVAYLKQMEN